MGNAVGKDDVGVGKFIIDDPRLDRGIEPSDIVGVEESAMDVISGGDCYKAVRVDEPASQHVEIFRRGLGFSLWILL